MERRLVIIGIQESNLQLLQHQLFVIFGEYIPIYGMTLKELTHEKMRPNDVVLVTTHEIVGIVKPFLKENSVLLGAQRSENLLEMREIFSFTEPKRILVVNDNYTNTMETLQSLHRLLPIHSFFPYIPNESIPNHIDIVITPGERDLIPAGFSNVYDIGSRILALETIYAIRENFAIEIDETLLHQVYVKSMIYLSDDYEQTHRTPTLIDENKQRLFRQVQTNSARFLQTIQLAKDYVHAGNVIHIEGELGTGKQMLAEMIHNEDGRMTGAPFFTYNCLEKDPKMIQDDLFGNERAKGLLYTFAVGTFYLKNIDTLPSTIQDKLAVVIEELENSHGENVRIITSTIEPLQFLYEEQIVREALYVKIRDALLRLPSLRERKEDLMTLINDFKNHFQKTDLVFDQEAIQVLTAYDWPGNIRELFNVISYCVCLDTGYITVNTLPLIFKGTPRARAEDLSREEKEQVTSMIEAIEQHGFLAESIALLEIYEVGKRKNEAYGRQRVKQLLETKQVYLTEQQLRLRISILSDLGLVNIRKGRAGTIITREGEMFLTDYKQLALEK